MNNLDTFADNTTAVTGGGTTDMHTSHSAAQLNQPVEWCVLDAAPPTRLYGANARSVWGVHIGFGLSVIGCWLLKTKSVCVSLTACLSLPHLKKCQEKSHVLVNSNAEAHKVLIRAYVV
jgi:hypothetical protein